jgi:hypothetical protein
MTEFLEKSRARGRSDALALRTGPACPTLLSHRVDTHTDLRPDLSALIA